MTGSQMYMSPEVHGRLPYNEKADVFSFAVLLYELLARSMLVFSHLGTRLPVVRARTHTVLHRGSGGGCWLR